MDSAQVINEGIILAGDAGTRLYPLATTTSKQLLPVYDKPIVYYPLSRLMLAGIREVVIKKTSADLDAIRRLLDEGTRFGICIRSAIQPKSGLAVRRGQRNDGKVGGHTSWLDMGAPDSLLKAANFVQAVERQQGRKIACLEQVAFRRGFINVAQVERLADALSSDYGRYLQSLLEPFNQSENIAAA